MAGLFKTDVMLTGGPRREKTRFRGGGGVRTTQSQTNLRIRAVWSAPLLFAFSKNSYVNLLPVKFQFSS